MHEEIELIDKSKRRFLLSSKGNQISCFTSHNNGKIVMIPESKIDWEKRIIDAHVDEKIRKKL